MAATAKLSPLRGADGSAAFSTNGISVLASVNGPLEVQRRDEIPNEAAVEVAIRPAAGVAGVRERHFESILHRVLRQIIRVEMHPRTLIQVTLQVIALPDQDATSGRPNQAASMLYLLPPLLNAAMLALLSTSIPLFTTMTSVCVGHSRGAPIIDPPLHAIQDCSSIHALAYSSHGGLLMAESEGAFDIETWEAVAGAAESKCRATTSDQEDVAMTQDDTSLHGLLRTSVEARIRSAEAWRQAIR